MLKICHHCNKEFSTKYSDQLYCGGRCKAVARDRRNGIQPISLRNWEVGRIFTRLIIVRRATSEDLTGRTDSARSRQFWVCDCECGTSNFIARADKLDDGRVQSCGCLKKELSQQSKTVRINKRRLVQQTNQEAKDRALREKATVVAEKNDPPLSEQHRFTFNSWSGARSRCTNVFHAAYADYGGRGIRMSDYWIDSFENFFKQMGERPLGKTLDRVDPNGNYELANCRWATPSQQAFNTRKRRSNNRMKQALEERKLREFIRSVAWG